jgi:hypothetical protein
MARKSNSGSELQRTKGRAKRHEYRAKQLKKIQPRQLLELLPVEVMEELAEQTGVDVQVKRLFGPLIVMLFILAVIDDEDHSLESLADLYNSSRFSSFSGKGGHKTVKSSLSSRLSTIKCEYIEQLYERYVEALRKKYGKALGKKGEWLTRFDSTMLALCASLTDIGMRVGAKPKKGEGKVQIKVTLGLQGLLPSQVKVSHEQSMLSEERALKAAIEASPDGSAGVVTFDMGLKSRKTLKGFDQAGRLFVTRLKDPRHEVVRTHSQIKGRRHGELRFVSDEIVHLYSSGHRADSLVEHEFRLVRAECESGKNAGKTFFFLTNILHMSAFEIADIYRQRWDIEVFFRFLKQEVGLRNLLSTNQNGIRAVIFLRLLAGTMIWAYAHLNKRKDYKRLKAQFRDELNWQMNITVGKFIAATGITDKEKLMIEIQGLLHPNTD